MDPPDLSRVKATWIWQKRGNLIRSKDRIECDRKKESEFKESERKRLNLKWAERRKWFRRLK